MIISKEFLRENKNFVSDTKTPFLVLDLKHFHYFNDVERFEFAIEVLNVVNSVSWINKVCQDLNSDYCIDSAVFYEVMDCLFTEKPLNSSRLFTYFRIQQEIENLSTIFKKVAETDRNFQLPIEVDFMILGVDLERYHDLHDDLKSELHEDYTMLFSKMKSGEIEIDQFVFKTKNLLSVVEKDATEVF